MTDRLSTIILWYSGYLHAICLRFIPMTTAQVYMMSGTENEMLSHIKSRKLRYSGHVVMRQPHDNVEGSVMVGLEETVEDSECAGLINIWQWAGLSGDSLLCYTPWETEVVGRHWLIHAANLCEATTAKWHLHDVPRQQGAPLAGSMHSLCMRLCPSIKLGMQHHRQWWTCTCHGSHYWAFRNLCLRRNYRSTVIWATNLHTQCLMTPAWSGMLHYHAHSSMKSPLYRFLWAEKKPLSAF